jgi:hypothetical protein
MQASPMGRVKRRNAVFLILRMLNGVTPMALTLLRIQVRSPAFRRNWACRCAEFRLKAGLQT